MKPFFCRRELAREACIGSALILNVRVIVDVLREQARSYRVVCETSGQVLEPSNIFNPAPTVVTSDEIGTMAPLAERQASLW